MTVTTLLIALIFAFVIALVVKLLFDVISPRFSQVAAGLAFLLTFLGFMRGTLW